MGIIREIIVRDDFTGKSEGCSQGIHILGDCLAKSLNDSCDKLDQKIGSHTKEDKPDDDFCIYYFFLLQLSYNHNGSIMCKKNECSDLL